MASIEHMRGGVNSIEKALRDLESVQRWFRGDELFHEGTDPHGIYVLHWGRVNLVFSATNGNEKPLRTAETGQILGLGAVLSRLTHEYSAVVHTECQTGFISSHDLMRVLAENPRVWQNVLRLLCEDINDSYQSLRLLAAS